MDGFVEFFTAVNKSIVKRKFKAKMTVKKGNDIYFDSLRQMKINYKMKQCQL